MNKKGVLAEKMGFYIAFIFLFSFAFLYAASFYGTSTEFNSENIEDSIVATRVLSCFSDDKIGIIDESKMNEDELRKCFAFLFAASSYGSDKYWLGIKLKKKNGEDKVLAPYGEISKSRIVKRYVKLKDGEGVLEIKYVRGKN